MSEPPIALPECLAHSPVRVIFGPNQLSSLGQLAKEERATHALLVCDSGVRKAGYVGKAIDSLERAGVRVTTFSDVHENPTTADVARGLAVARSLQVDFILALGGGSVMDCAKGMNLLLTNGGAMADYWGINKATKPTLPMIAIPTTAGTGSEAQSFALISDEVTHQKMACGDRRLPRDGGLRPRIAILDPELTRTQPAPVAAATGIDAIAHAIETAGCKAANAISLQFSKEAWRRLSTSYERAMQNPADDQARANMLLGAHLAGCAIEQSMLGAAHACANPLTARFGITHGVAVAVMLPHVIRLNAEIGSNPYCHLHDDLGADELVDSVYRFTRAGRLPRALHAMNIDRALFPAMAEEAAKQWTATFNPKPVGPREMLELYNRAWN